MENMEICHCEHVSMQMLALSSQHFWPELLAWLKTFVMPLTQKVSSFSVTVHGSEW